MMVVEKIKAVEVVEESAMRIEEDGMKDEV